MKVVNNIIQDFKRMGKFQQSMLTILAAPQVLSVVQSGGMRGPRLKWDISSTESRNFKKVMLIQQEAEPMPGWHRPPATNLVVDLYPEVFERSFG